MENAPENDVSFKKSRVAIVGAGPTGLMTAIALADSGFTDIKIIESLTDPAQFDRSRSYTLVLYKNGSEVFNKIPALGTLFKKNSVCQYIRIQYDVSPNGMVKTSSKEISGAPVHWIMKYNLVALLRTYLAENHPNVEIISDTKVTDISINRSEDLANSVELVIQENGAKNPKNLPVDLILACDGSSSKLRNLASLYDSQIISSNSMHMFSESSPSVGMCHRGIMLSANPIISPPGEPDQFADHTGIYSFHGETKNRSADEVFKMMLLPVGPNSETNRIAVTCLPKSHKLWTVTKVEEAYEMFKENFPQLRIDDLISREEMEKFLKTKPSTFTMLQRPKSLTGVFRETKTPAGIVFLGDSAHCFPPDLAQGINSAMADAKIFKDCLDQSSSIPEALKNYDDARDKDIWALLELSKFGAPFQYGQDFMGLARHKLNGRLRSMLACLLPGIFYNNTDKLIREGLEYSVVRKRVHGTTRNMWLATLMAVAVPVATKLMRAASKSE